jgi:pimeloyl-ACP methyl ester carboxylesterase
VGDNDGSPHGRDHFDVESADGTTIAVWPDGQGAPLVLVHGTLNDHTTFSPLVNVLRSRFSLFVVDRRGRGASGDADPGGYTIEREFEDVAAVVDAVADRTGSPVVLWGHSYGADCAMGGAARSGGVSHLVIYEPGLGLDTPPGSFDPLERALAAGDREGATVALLRDIVGVTDEQLDFLRSSPTWPTRLAIVHTTPRELRAETEWVYAPGQFDAVTAPTLLLSGSESSDAQQRVTRLAADAIPNARIQVLEGHGHLAHQVDPERVAQLIEEFVAS